MTASRDQLNSEVSNAGAYCGIVDGVADAQLQTAQQGVIHVQYQNGFELKVFLNRSADAGLEFVGQLDRRGDLHAQPARTFVVQFVQRPANRPDQIEAIVIVQDQQKLVEDVAGLARERLVKSFLARVAPHRGPGEQRFEAGGALDGRGA